MIASGNQSKTAHQHRPLPRAEITIQKSIDHQQARLSSNEHRWIEEVTSPYKAEVPVTTHHRENRHRDARSNQCKVALSLGRSAIARQNNGPRTECQSLAKQSHADESVPQSAG